MWLIRRSFWRNRKRYSLFMIAMALSILVASLGLSSVDFAANMWRKPFVGGFGGHIIVRYKASDEGVLGLNGVFSTTGVTELVQEIYPDAVLTTTLDVPSRPLTDKWPAKHMKTVTGRAGGLDVWYLNPDRRTGEAFGEGSAERDVFFSHLDLLDETGVSAQVDLLLAKFDPTDTVMRFEQAQPITIEVVGTTQWPSFLCLTHIDTLQRLTSTPTDIVSCLGIALPGLQARIDPQKLEQLRVKLAAEFPQLELVTIDEMGAEVSQDLIPLRESIKATLPVMLGISSLVIVATSLAILQSRRRELVLLRVVGMSARQVWMAFVCEVSIASALACGIGVLLAKITGYLFFGGRIAASVLRFIAGILSAEVSLLPFMLSLIVTVLTAATVSAWVISRQLTKVLRNA